MVGLKQPIYIIQTGGDNTPDEAIGALGCCYSKPVKGSFSSL